ncbi:MAG: hypothetical protein Q9195_004251 [Heterodermia aff. obscurata]
MTSVLASQLAQIRAKSSNSLNLKAQKKAHSKSLLFEPQIAATQDFDTLYQICYEGFIELCRLDSRFTNFSGSIFSEQSKLEDRTLLTEAQNKRLDSILENFLGLVGSRLLLKPALQAVEWIVRRFRVHEHNVNYFIITFLPYHEHPIFPTVLSILPRNLPQTLKFLYPYIQSLSCPPRHAVVYSVSHNQGFFAFFCGYVLKVSRLGLQYPALLSFWASITTEATGLMLDQARSGRREAQIQYQEDVIMRVMPILNDGLSLDGIADLRVGCYMILTIISSKATLSNAALASMMDAVVLGWEETSLTGLICLAVMAQKKQPTILPVTVYKALINLKNLKDDLSVLKRRYRVDKLTLGVILGMIDELHESTTGEVKGKLMGKSGSDFVDQMCTLFEGDFLTRPSVVEAVERMLALSVEEAPTRPQTHKPPKLLTCIIIRLAASQSVGITVRETVRRFSSTHEGLLQVYQALELAVPSSQDVNDDDGFSSVSIDLDKEPFDSALSRIESRIGEETSFLSHSESPVFSAISDAFVGALASPSDLCILQDLPVLRKSVAMTEPFFLPFYVRLWCGHRSPQARSTAIETVSKYLAQQELVSDVQILLPYLLYALLDSSRKVRQASGKLVLLLATKYRGLKDSNERNTIRVILGQDQIYGPIKPDEQLVWLYFDEVIKLLNDFLVPNLEESLLDARHFSESLALALNGESRRSRPSNAKDLKTSLRQAIFAFLCNHVTHTPLKSVQLRLLPILNRISKVGSLTRSKALMPLYTKSVEKKEDELRNECDESHVEAEQFIKELAGILSPTDRDSVTALKNAIRPGMRSEAPLLNSAVHLRIRNIWSSINVASQLLLAETLLELCVLEANSGSATAEQSDAAETLQSVELSSHTLIAFLEHLPSLIGELEDKSWTPKKRKTDLGQISLRAATPQTLKYTLRTITFVLELISACKPERHPELLSGLFQLLVELKNYRNLSGSELGYLEVLTLASASAIIDKPQKTSAWQLDHSAVRADVLIECVGATENPQVQQAAMLLASSIASIAPELLLHNVMPLFTFAGKGIMRNNDEYSAHVIEKTMMLVIPRLVESLHKRRVDPLISISELLLSFVAAYQDIPLRRRQGIFASLSSCVGADDFLFALLVLLVDKYPGDQGVIDFAARLTAQQGCRTQLITVEKYFDVLLDSENSKPALSSHLLETCNNHATKDTFANLLPLPIAILNAENLKTKIGHLLNKKGDDATFVRLRYARIFEQVLTLNEISKTKAQSKKLGAEGFGALLRLLSLDKFVEALPELLQQTDSNIVEKFGKQEVSAVTAVADTVCGPDCLEAKDASTQISSLLCLATIVEVLREAFISMVPRVLPKVMDHLTTSIKEGVENPKLHNAVYTFMTALLVYLPWILQGIHLDNLLRKSYESANAEMGDDCDQLRSDTLQLVAKSIDAKECLMALDRTWTVAMVEGPLAVKEYIDILSLLIEKQTKSAVTKQSHLLATIFIKMFDLRRIQCSPRTEDSYEDSELETVEAFVNNTLIAMVYKLNDAVFRPIFIKFSDWANGAALKPEKGSKLHRRVTWWMFQLQFFRSMKSIATSYAGLILNDAVEILTTSSLKNDDSRLLWLRVLLTLQSAFEHDQDDFFQTPSHFTPICTSLVSQLRLCAGDSSLSVLITAITTLAATTDSPAQHKSLCGPLLHLIRDNNAAVRLTAVKCQLSLTDRLGEEWLAQLPEMLPFISEGMEDDDEGVGTEVRRWVKRIEDILGESIGPMLH